MVFTAKCDYESYGKKTKGHYDGYSKRNFNGTTTTKGGSSATSLHQRINNSATTLSWKQPAEPQLKRAICSLNVTAHTTTSKSIATRIFHS